MLAYFTIFIHTYIIILLKIITKTDYNLALRTEYRVYREMSQLE